MFKGLGNLANMGSFLKHAQEMGNKLQGVNDELRTRRVEGTAGGGLVTVQANGLGDILSCRIDPTLTTGDDRELIEDLLPAAVNQALTKAKQLHNDAMKSMAENMPGLGEVLSGLGASLPKDSPSGETT